MKDAHGKVNSRILTMVDYATWSGTRVDDLVPNMDNRFQQGSKHFYTDA